MQKNDYSYYEPSPYEIDDVISFLMNCCDSDAINVWKNIQKEWDGKSLSNVFLRLCNLGKHEIFINNFSMKE
tara:strand:+ start:29279 stop:29494 length:216 start_codon:yes stop_codon:yes gene_type:complete